ncbi:thioredoxin family protein [Desertibacillus haloalkaliphilus]|uniref:thioredoxin family protein n=1 Tax=Desertibacillus haloalkaliphilus TaxID=1328930 RepID=UPI001C2639A1|nr:thioredoxin family protein [Desertibacillus haloalkaliphilus]MBU8907311.1 thioredoxin family protein [Desertibacillus haloalkaliphilus]
MKELQQAEVNEKMANNFSVFYFYTPLCGTCKMATKMITVVEQLIHDVGFFACNINTMPEITNQLKIKSVPYLVLIDHGEVIADVYAFKSVGDIYQLIKSHV